MIPLGNITFKQFMDLAFSHYDEGGRTYCETWTQDIFDRWVKVEGPITKMLALKWFRDQAKADREWDEQFDNSNYKVY